MVNTKQVKVLSLRQPWADLFVLGAKKFETRSWQTNFRGELYIHASSKFHFCDLDTCRDDPHYKKFIPDPTKLIVGAIIGKVEIIDCLPVSKISKLTDQERAFGDYRPGRFAWIGINHEKFEVPIPASGSLSIWNFELSQVQIDCELTAVIRKEPHHG